MKNFSRTFLVNSISIVLFGGGLTQTIWANNEITALPTIKVAAEKEQEKPTFATGDQQNTLIQFKSL